MALLVIEDGAQAFGATLNDVPCGAFGDMACISLNAMKVLGAMGDAGVVLTDDAGVAKRLDILRHSGVTDREYCQTLSHNCRLDTLQAAVLLRRLVRLPATIDRRRNIAARYGRELAGLVATPPSTPGYKDAVYTYTIRTSHRDKLQAHLTGLGIETRIQHPLTMNDQPAFQGKFRGEAPRAARLVREILCIPAHEKMSDVDQTFVIESIRSFFKR